MVNMLKAPVAYPWVHAKAIRCPSGCHDALEASPIPGVNLSKSEPSMFIRYTCCGPERPEENTISFPVFGFTFGSTSMTLDEEIGRNPVPSKFATKIRQHLPVPAEDAYTICFPSGVTEPSSFTDAA